MWYNEKKTNKGRYMENRRERFNIKFNWQVHNGKLKEINSYSYSCFKFKFKIVDQNTQEEFAQLVTGDNDAFPWDICNFFVQRDIKFSINFRYVKGAKFKANFEMFKEVMRLKKEHLRVIIVKNISNIKFSKTIKKKQIAGKERLSFFFEIINLKTNTIYFLQADSNCWWKPKKNIIDTENGKGVAIGWLFAQIGKFKVNMHEDNVNQSEGEVV
ncbi:MAG: hypothetical protein K0R54_649 [Clostridiaceae bacterium]|jgi:hypothetical protein|nr:hypothetical protein [Clostridiaceae bacterium]